MFLISMCKLCHYFIIFPPNLSFINPITFLDFPLGNDLSNYQFEVSNFVSISFVTAT